ncbi:response regulator transcription factor [Maribacter sp. 2210JD10-5]|uniref:response regulator transcription factor n=1 Tax=Maribacter sp. 2210JD10-5 TaxID=3386272 RepID=UPI0039BD84B3
MLTNTMKIMVIENDRLLESAYESYFESFEKYDLVGFYDKVTPALKDVKRLRPDIVISEIDLSEMKGIDAIKPLRRKDWGLKIIMVSENNRFDVVKKAFKKGANGYLTKPLNAEKLHHALTCVKEEGATISNDIVKQIVSNFQRKSFKFFSERENQIADYLCKGATYKMIAEKLFVTTSTVNFHIQNIYLKLDVNSKSEALTKLQSM